jgi:hypothetical protein
VKLITEDQLPSKPAWWLLDTRVQQTCTAIGA